MNKPSTIEDIKNIILNDNQMVDILENVRSLNLPDWYIGAGFVRNKVWNILHELKDTLFFEDIDIVYFNRKEISKNGDTEIEEHLNELKPKLKWSVKNQARMHQRNFHSPYLDTEDGIRHWTETATCIGIRIEMNKEIRLVVPYGTEDLVNLILRPTPYSGNNYKIFFDRINKKGWLKRWPKLKIILA